MTIFSVIAIVTLALFCVDASGLEGGADSSLMFDVNAAKERPVSKVVTLLKDMLKELEKEAEEDEEIYDKIACWCETNDKEKTKAIKDAEEKVTALLAHIEEYSAISARLDTEIKFLHAELVKYTVSIDKASALRMKQNAEFNEEEKDLLESIAALKSAIIVLSKHHDASLLQAAPSHLLSVAKTLQREMHRHSDLLKGVLTHKQRREVAAFMKVPGAVFVQAPGDYFDAEPTFEEQSYQPASGQILGILKQMLETFQSNLGDIQKDEGAAQKAYESLKVSITFQITTCQARIDKKEAELAHTNEKVAMWKEDLADTKAGLSEDEKFLMMLKEKCQITDQEWEARQKARKEEIEAVSKALAILTSDDAHAMFSKTFNPEFIQEADSTHKSLQSQVSKFLMRAALKVHSPQLAAIASQVSLDAFTKVKQAIDDMIKNLLKEQSDEIKKKDFCVADFNKNDLETQDKEHEQTDTEAKIEDLKMTIEQLTKDLEVLKAECKEMQLQLKHAGEDRAVENKDFQATLADQRATQKLLASALKVLKGFYQKSAAFAQEDGAELEAELDGPPAPAGFKKMEKSEKAGGVMGLLQQIINDAKAMEAETIRDEADAQKAYEAVVKKTGAAIEEKLKDITNKSEIKGKTETDLIDTEKALDDIMIELDGLNTYKLQLHASCDFVMKNFEARQAARSDEIEALKQAKAILSGANFEAFLEDTDAA